MRYRIPAALLAATAALGLSACTTDGYGYGGVGLGYGSGYYGDPYWGWYDNYYYPGTGYYVYDRGGARHRWNDGQRRYWEGRRGSRPARENWSGFRRDRDAGTPSWRGRPQQNSEASRQRQERREAWRAQRQQRGEAAGQSRAQRSEAWRAQRQQQQQQGTPSWRGRAGRGQQD